MMGCSNSKNTHKVIFSDEINIEYQEQVDTSQFVKRVDSFLINDSMRQGNRINVSNFSVICPELESKKLGKVKLIYKIGSEEYSVDGKIVDTTKPKIYIDDKDLIFDYNAFSSKKLKGSIHCKDNYDSRNEIVITLKGIDKVNDKKAGEYPVIISAIDSSGNKSKKKIKIKINEENKVEEVEIGEKPIKDSNAISNDLSNINKVPEQQPVVPPPQPQVPSYSSKDYLFSDGYDMNTAPSACQADLFQSGRSGSCVPIKDENGIYLGMRLTFR